MLRSKMGSILPRMGTAIGIDVGGTFVDVVVQDDTGLRLAKVSSTPGAPEAGVLSCLGDLIARGAIRPGDVDRIAHGSTVATNALLEGRWGRTALLTTSGFRDVLEIGRQNRPSLYDLFFERAAPVVPRDLRFEVRERVDSRGEVRVALAEEDVRRIGARLREREVQAIAAHFDGLDDPRSEINLRHPLASVLTIVVMAVLAGADGPTAIARWAKIKSHFLRDLLDLPHGVPAKDVFRNVLCRLKPAAFQACFATWLDNLRARAASGDDVMRRLLNVDGKTSRRSHDRAKDLGPLHSVSVWAADERMTLAQVACDEKSNEITAIPEVLKLVPLEGRS